ncbi:hypothetical protein [Corynebacterium lujinxingii]|uniref:Uncharacterized protein n=1 Tax=Corynebacterium lujinxingii TaxID=2763010 RepID=A0A7H0K1P5_9CORY|nr:hypothetical protein [Corynebacterium lujinxingii]MBC3178681.1 hypothetical protein [Corynebacterium lujinxingii]NNO10389.1 hypothetical protein [Corynebacterium lujinxingii]QNP91211.1 hypothetical protein IAU68_05550 [Corynebacterium lujinxingii]
MKQIARTAACALTLVAVATGAPLASAADRTAGDIAVTPYAAGVVGDMFECGGSLGRLWCK